MKVEQNHFLMYALVVHACMLSLFSCVQLCNSAKLFCPWDSPGKNSGMGCHFLLQEISLTQGQNPCQDPKCSRAIKPTATPREARAAVTTQHSQNK